MSRNISFFTSLIFIGGSSLGLISCGSEIIANLEEEETTENTLSVLSSDIDRESIYAEYKVNDGFFNHTRRAAVILTYRQDQGSSETVFFDQGEKIYANDEEVNYYENSSWGYYSAWVDLAEDASIITIRIIDRDGNETSHTIELAERVQINNFDFGEIGPELNEGIDVAYQPAINVTANFNVGGGECQNHFDHDSNSLRQISFGMGSLRDQDEENELQSGETIYLRLRNQQISEAPNGFNYGRVISNGYTNLELIVP